MTTHDSRGPPAQSVAVSTETEDAGGPDCGVGVPGLGRCLLVGVHTCKWSPQPAERSRRASVPPTRPTDSRTAPHPPERTRGLPTRRAVCSGGASASGTRPGILSGLESRALRTSGPEARNDRRTDLHGSPPPPRLAGGRVPLRRPTHWGEGHCGRRQLGLVHPRQGPSVTSGTRA